MNAPINLMQLGGAKIQESTSIRQKENLVIKTQSLRNQLIAYLAIQNLPSEKALKQIYSLIPHESEQPESLDLDNQYEKDNKSLVGKERKHQALQFCQQQKTWKIIQDEVIGIARCCPQDIVYFENQSDKFYALVVEKESMSERGLEYMWRKVCSLYGVSICEDFMSSSNQFQSKDQ
eukprot:TRINITY_DN4424_c0_g1_i2.p3 TRINITY_DN4424_c0_g1~~TRINITY_DN4424_c0_g1_i2.p3  ORF type:complete len:177 (+),score=16.02 TRINITY_DN4424_c0_g1_i2:187-717(+)